MYIGTRPNSYCYCTLDQTYHEAAKRDSLLPVKLGNKEQFDKEQIGIKEPFPVTNLPLTS